MRRLSRRAFLAALASAVPAASLVRRAHALSIDHLATDARTLRALGDVVLPSELGSARITAAVSAFQHWIAGYRAGAELLHGYGTSVLEHAGPTPATRWSAQLDALGPAFANLPLTRRREIVQSALGDATSLPSVGRAPHVALALLAHWTASPDATDLCYRAHIGKQTCRPLAAQTRKPLPIAGSHA